MTTRTRIWFSLGMLVLAATTSGTVSAQFDADRMNSIREAKKAGWRELTVIGPGDRDSDATLDERSRRSSVVKLSLVRKDVAQSISSSSELWSWHVFRVEESLSDASKVPAQSSCLGSPDLSAVQAGEVAVMMYGGTTVVEGLKVRFAIDWSFDRVPSPFYVAFLNYCSNRGAILLDGPSGWLHIDKAGRFIPSGGRNAAAQQVERMMTMSALAEWLRGR